MSRGVSALKATASAHVIAVTIATAVRGRARVSHGCTRNSSASSANRCGSTNPVSDAHSTESMDSRGSRPSAIEQRRAVDGEQDAQDRAEVAKIRQCGGLRRLSYNPMHSGCNMQASCRMPAFADAAGQPGRCQGDPDRERRSGGRGRRPASYRTTRCPHPRESCPTRIRRSLPTPHEHRTPPVRCRPAAPGRVASASRCPSGCSASTLRSISTGAWRAPISRGPARMPGCSRRNKS